MSGSWSRRELPNLDDSVCDITSPCDTTYNCIAYAADDPGRWWWPDVDGFWPEGARRDATMEAFVDAFAQLGYIECSDGVLEADHEKVALYAFLSARGDLTPTHAAKQLSDGRWTSKLGTLEDIAHRSVDDVSGPAYGNAVRYLKRPRQLILH